MSSKKRKAVAANEEVAERSVSDVLKPVNELRSTMQASEETLPRVAAARDLVEGITEVEDLPCEEVSKKIEDVVVSIVSQIISGNSFELTMPNRASSNQVYIEELDRIVLGNKISKRQFYQ